jgi:hypothetical protein
MRVPYLHWRRLTPDDVQVVIDDLILMQKGARLYFAVDPSEVFDFSFPLNPFELKLRGINSIADDQIALYEVFHVNRSKPLILQEYHRELRRIHNYVSSQVTETYTKTEMLREIIKLGDVGAIGRPGPSSVTSLQETVEDDFNIILAIMMGLTSAGVQRFGQVVRQRLSVERLDVDSVPINKLFKEYAETDLIGKITSELERLASGKRETPLHMERRRRADRVDALAIDKLIFLNNSLEKLYLKNRTLDVDSRGELNRRHIILYLSSAPKTRTVFELDSVRKAFPVIGKVRYPFWRTRAQVFSYVVHKSDHPDGKKSLAETIANLRGVKGVLEEIQKIGASATAHESCQHCVLDGMSGEGCKIIDYCRKLQQLNISMVEKSIRKRRAKIQNLGLVNSIESYQRLISNKPSGEFKNFQEWFKKLYENEDIKDLAIERKQVLQWLLITNTEFTNVVSNVHLRKDPFLRANRDVITGTAQYLPIVFQVTDPQYERMLELIVEYYQTPPQGDQNKENLFYDVYSQFLEIDTNLKEQNFEHELMRCLMYLAIPNVVEENAENLSQHVTGDQMALTHAEKLINESSLRETQPHLEQEFSAIVCWAARRRKKYAFAETWANRSIDKWKNDPRFYHARSLNTYAWLNDENEKVQCKLSLRDAISDAEKAIELYSRDSEKYLQLIGANYNNLAYFWAQEYAASTPSSAGGDIAISEAGRALITLEKLIERQTWVPNHPEYFETAAFVGYHEYSHMRKQHEPLSKLIEKLTHAKDDIDQALKLFQTTRRPGPYRALKKSINHSLQRLKPKG